MRNSHKYASKNFNNIHNLGSFSEMKTNSTP